MNDRAHLTSQERGQKAEAAVAAAMEGAGCVVLARNFRVERVGELDLVAAYRGTILFVEVRARQKSRFGSGADSITPAKVRKIRMTASIYLARARYMNHSTRLLAADVLLDQRGVVEKIHWIPMD